MQAKRKTLYPKLLSFRSKVTGWFQDLTFRRLIQNTGMLVSSNVIVAILGFLATVIKTRTLGVQQFGLLSVIIANVMLIQSFASFGSWQALIKFGAEALKHDLPDDFMAQVKLALLLDGIGCISGCAIGFLSAFLLPKWLGWSVETSHWMILFSLNILFDLSGTPEGVLRLLDKFGLIAIKNISISILSLVGALFVSLTGGGIQGFLVVTMVASLVGSVILMVLAVIELRKRNLMRYWLAPINNWKPSLRFSFWTYMTMTLDIPVNQLDILIVSAVISLESAGVYKIIKQLIGMLGMLADPVYQAVYPQFALMIAHQNNRGAVKYAIKIGLLLLVVVGFIVFGLTVTSPWWLVAIFGESFRIGVVPLNVFLYLKVFSISAIVIHPLFRAMGYAKQTSLIQLVVNPIYLALAWQLGRTLGLLGLGIAYGVQFSSVVGLKAFYIARYGLKNKPVQFDKESAL